MLTRRTALGLLASMTALPSHAAFYDAEQPGYLSAFQSQNGGYGIAFLANDGTVLHKALLPGRGHGAIIRPDRQQAIIMARRPGTFALVFDLKSGQQTAMVPAVNGRHFFGHGTFSPDGRLFYATENDIEGERGVIGIYDATAGYDRVGEFDSHGIGPHEIILLPNGSTLAVANGGILTHPDLPRVKLNLPDMSPSIAFIDRLTGELLGQVQPPPDWHQLSLRHLAVNKAGDIAIAAQWEGSESEAPPLVGLCEKAGPLRFVKATEPVHLAMRQYCGSVAFNRAGNKFAVSAPRGDTITYWHADGRFDHAEQLTDGSGIAPSGAGFLRTSGMGQVRLPDGSQKVAPLAWDNHITSIG